jgi:hypothetical protein
VEYSSKIPPQYGPLIAIAIIAIVVSTMDTECHACNSITGAALTASQFTPYVHCCTGLRIFLGDTAAFIWTLRGKKRKITLAAEHSHIN